MVNSRPLDFNERYINRKVVHSRHIKSISLFISKKKTQAKKTHTVYYHLASSTIFDYIYLKYINIQHSLYQHGFNNTIIKKKAIPPQGQTNPSI